MGRGRRRGGLWVVGLVTVVGVMIASSLATTIVRANPRIPDPITTNPYTGASSSPDCTWYAWQRLHDTEGIDMQLTANAGGWAIQAAKPYAFWSERLHAFVPAQILSGATSTPSAGDIVVLPDAVAHWAYPYHVVYVESVKGDVVTISEQSYQDYGPGPDTQPYPFVTHRTFSLAAMRQAEPRASFLHFPIIDNAEYVAESDYPTVRPGQAFTISFIERNTGNTTWTDAGKYRLACLKDCMSVTSVGLGGKKVAPGQEIEFQIHLTATKTLGIYSSIWRMEHKGKPFGNDGMFMRIIVQAVDDAEWAPADQQVAIHAVAGQSLFLHVSYTNTGDTTWTDVGGYELDCDANPTDSAGCLNGMAAGLFGQRVAPGQTAKFLVYLVAPSLPGTYRTYWDMRHNGTLFGDATGHLDITVTQPTPPDQGVK